MCYLERLQNKNKTEDNWRLLCIYLTLETIFKCVWLVAFSLCSIGRYKKKQISEHFINGDSNPIKLLPLLIITTMFIIFLCYSPAMVADEDDTRCLRGTQTFITDSHWVFKSWNFANTTLGFLCNFVLLEQSGEHSRQREREVD